MLDRFDGAPAPLIVLIAETEVEERCTFFAAAFDHQPEQQFTRACLGDEAFIDRAELADDVVALARQSGNRGDLALKCALEADGMKLERRVQAASVHFEQHAEERLRLR